MWTTKGRIACFLIITVLAVILFTPAQGYCVVFKGNLVRPDSSQTPLSNVRVFLYDWDLVKQQGLVTISPITKTGTTVGGYNFQVDLKDTVSLDKEYLLLFSTQEIARTVSYPSFFYGAYNEADYSNPSKFSKQTKWDPTNVPKIRFTSGTFDLGTFNPPYTGADEGIWLFGSIKDENGNLKKDVGVELYADQNGIPVLLPYPFYRLVETDEPDSLGRNFRIGGLLKNTIYYIKFIANHLGYIDTFYAGQDPNVPTQFILTGNKVADEFRLTHKGARIWGYLKDKENNNPITNSVILIQAISYTDDQQVRFMQNYVHDPNYQRFDMLPDVDKHFFGYDRFSYNANGLYEIKGLPFEDHEYILVATELPGETPKKFATPLFYDGNDGVFNINQAKTISLPGAGTSYRVDFSLIKPCEGDFDSDGNVDGSDLTVFAADFGRTDCLTGPICEGDFDSDGDVDGSDLAVLASDFDRTDCPILQFKVIYSIGSGWTGWRKTITITGDGVVNFEEVPPFQQGEIIKKSGKLSESKIQEFIKLVEDANVFELNDEYTCSPDCPTDLPYSRIRFILNEREKEIYMYVPLKLPDTLVQIINKILEIEEEL